MTQGIGNAVRPSLRPRGHAQMVESDSLFWNVYIQSYTLRTPSLHRRRLPRLLFVNYNTRSPHAWALLASIEIFPETPFLQFSQKFSQNRR